MNRIDYICFRHLLIAAMLCFGLAITSTASAEDEGEALFDAQCADCHGTRDIAWWAEQYPDEDERRAWLDRFLQRHYPPAEDERALVVDHIERMIADD